MGGNDEPAAFEKIEMSSMEGCQKEGNFWKKEVINLIVIEKTSSA